MNELIAIQKIAGWEKLKTLVLDSVSSPITKRVYNMALDEFLAWFQQAPRPGFTKATVSAWRVSLEARGLGSSSIIIRMSAIRKLAAEAADNGLLAPELAAGISRVKSAKTQGIRTGNWLSLRQAHLCSILDGCSRHIVNWDLRESMTEADIEIILQAAKEKYPEARPRIISDNGPQFIAKDFKEFIRISGMTHVRTSPYYPQSNGKIERWHKSLKGECIRPGTPLSLEDARRLVQGYVEYYNNVRLNSAVGYITPKDMLAGLQPEIHAERDRKLEEARKQRQVRRQQAA